MRSRDKRGRKKREKGAVVDERVSEDDRWWRAGGQSVICICLHPVADSCHSALAMCLTLLFLVIVTENSEKGKDRLVSRILLLLLH
jgi:hypothetical protein